MRPIGWVLLLLVAVIGTLDFWLPIDSAQHAEERLRQAVLAAGPDFGLTPSDALELAQRIAQSGQGSETEVRAVMYWLVCSHLVKGPAVEPLARTALVRVVASGTSPRQAVRDQLMQLAPAASDPLAACQATPH